MLDKPSTIQGRRQDNEHLRKAEDALNEMLAGYQSSITPAQVALILREVIKAIKTT